MKVLLVHPGVAWSVADVEAGLRYGLKARGATVIRYRLDQRLKDVGPYEASAGALTMALRHQVDAVVIVSAMLLHPDVIVLMRRAGLRVFVVFTESPYDHAHERRIAGVVNGCWTHERSVLEDFRAVNPHTWYLPHGWHPERHFVASRSLGDLPSHDVVFVGSGFPERITWLNAIDWRGIDLGLYGTWRDLGLRPEVEACVRGEQVTNAHAASLYRRAKIGLNLYRTGQAESLNPRAYELAACGVFQISEPRAELADVFGSLVPTFETPQQAEHLMRRWLADADERQRIAAELPSRVAEASWDHRVDLVWSRIAHAAPTSGGEEFDAADPPINGRRVWMLPSPECAQWP